MKDGLTAWVVCAYSIPKHVKGAQDCLIIMGRRWMMLIKPKAVTN